MACLFIWGLTRESYVSTLGGLGQLGLWLPAARFFRNPRVLQQWTVSRKIHLSLPPQDKLRIITSSLAHSSGWRTMGETELSSFSCKSILCKQS